MDATASDPSSGRRRQLQGPRPPRLAVNVESLKIKKPAVTRRLKTTEVIEVQLADFKAAVQRLTGLGAAVAATDYMDMKYTGPGPSMVSSPRVEFSDGSTAGCSSPPPSEKTVEEEGKKRGRRGEGRKRKEEEEEGRGRKRKKEEEERKKESPRPRLWLLSPTTTAVSASARARLAATERAIWPLSLPRPPTDYGEDADSLAAVLSLPGRPGILSPAALPPAAFSGQFSALPFDPSCLSWLKELTPFLPSASRCVEELECLFTLKRSTLLLPGMPCPATVSTFELFRDVLEILRN